MYASTEDLRVSLTSELRAAMETMYQEGVKAFAARLRVIDRLKKIQQGISPVASYAISATSRANAAQLQIVIEEFHDALDTYNAELILAKGDSKAAKAWRRGTGKPDDWEGPLVPTVLEESNISSRLLLSIDLAFGLQPLLAAAVADAAKEPRYLSREGEEPSDADGAASNLLEVETGAAAAKERDAERRAGSTF